MKKLLAIALLAALCLPCLAADSIGPNVPSVFTRIVSTNKTADAWRSALGAGSSANLTTVSNSLTTTAANLVTVSNAQVTTAANLVTVSNAQVTTAANLVTVSNAQITTAANLLSVSNSLTSTEANLVTVSNAQITTAANLLSVSNAQLVTAGNLVTVSNAHVATAANLLAVSNALDTKPTVALSNVAQLDQSQTFTGPTNIFGGNVMVTNFANFPRTRVIFATNNFFFPNLATNGAGFAGGVTTNTLTNLWLNTASFIPSNIFTIPLPPLRTTNELVSIQFELEYTNARPAISYGIAISLGTNRVQIVNPIGSTGATYPYHRIPSASGTLMALDGSYTNQIAANTSPLTSFVVVSSSYTNATYVDAAGSWDMTFEWGAQVPSAYELTNTFCRYFRVVVTTPADTRVQP